MSNEWDTLSKSGIILLKAARLLALSIHRLSATTSRIFLVSPPLLVALPSIGRLVILNVGDKREKESGLSRQVGTGIESGREAKDEAVRDGRTGAVRPEIPAGRSLLSDKLLIPKS